MKLNIQSSGVDTNDNLVHYKILIENEYFKGTIAFYGYTNIFTEFASRLDKFPFEVKTPVLFEADGLALSVSLADKAGKISLLTVINDRFGNKASFVDYSVETMDLQHLASIITATDFSIKQSIQWSSGS